LIGKYKKKIVFNRNVSFLIALTNQMNGGYENGNLVYRKADR
jgi:hypothetical protein